MMMSTTHNRVRAKARPKPSNAYALLKFLRQNVEEGAEFIIEQRSISRSLGMGDKALREAIEELIDRGLLQRLGRGGRGNAWRYRLGAKV